MYIEILSDGTFALFDTETGAIIFEFSGATGDIYRPYALTMQTVRPALSCARI